METRRTGLILRLVMVSLGNGRRRDLFIRRAICERIPYSDGRGTLRYPELMGNRLSAIPGCALTRVV
jgi:hypothetical protein